MQAGIARLGWHSGERRMLEEREWSSATGASAREESAAMHASAGATPCQRSRDDSAAECRARRGAHAQPRQGRYVICHALSKRQRKPARVAKGCARIRTLLLRAQQNGRKLSQAAESAQGGYHYSTVRYGAGSRSTCAPGGR